MCADACTDPPCPAGRASCTTHVGACVQHWHRVHACTRARAADAGAHVRASVPPGCMASWKTSMTEPRCRSGGAWSTMVMEPVMQSKHPNMPNRFSRSCNIQCARMALQAKEGSQAACVQVFRAHSWVVDHRAVWAKDVQRPLRWGMHVPTQAHVTRRLLAPRSPDYDAKRSQRCHQDGRGKGVSCKVRHLAHNHGEHSGPPYGFSQVREPPGA